MLESAAKRKLRRNQVAVLRKALLRIASGETICAAWTPHNDAMSLRQSSLSVGSALRSENTAPASTAESWSLSPSRMIRAVSGTASSNCVASARSSIEASSTTKASIASRLPAWWMNPSGLTPSRRWIVKESAGSLSRIACGKCAERERIASVIRAAALPVGAASAMRQSGFCAIRQASRLTTVVVLPVPGPPLMTVSRWRKASAVATLCQSGGPCVAPISGSCSSTGESASQSTCPELGLGVCGGSCGGACGGAGAS